MLWKTEHSVGLLLAAPCNTILQYSLKEILKEDLIFTGKRNYTAQVINADGRYKTEVKANDQTVVQWRKKGNRPIYKNVCVSFCIVGRAL